MDGISDRGNVFGVFLQVLDLQKVSGTEIANKYEVLIINLWNSLPMQKGPLSWKIFEKVDRVDK